MPHQYTSPAHFHRTLDHFKHLIAAAVCHSHFFFFFQPWTHVDYFDELAACRLPVGPIKDASYTLQGHNHVPEDVEAILMSDTGAPFPIRTLYLRMLVSTHWQLTT